jgi:two-component system NtrC family sensor kinase
MAARQRPHDHPNDSGLASAAVERSRLEAEMAALRAQNATLQEQLTLRDHALDATQSLFAITRLMEPEKHVIAYCNKSIADQFGLRRQDLVGQDAGLLTQWYLRNQDYRSRLSATLNAGATFHYEDEVTRKDGSTFILGISMTPIFDREGRLTHSVAIGADITGKREEARKKQELQDKLLEEMKERERMVLELQLAQKLESVGRLAAGVAHEINTPIQYVGDSVQFLRSAYDDLIRLLDEWKAALVLLPAGEIHDNLDNVFSRLTKKFDVDFIRSEMPRAFVRTFDGVERVATIVKAMKEFAHPDTEEQNLADLNHAIETTLLVASNEYKYVAKVHTEFAAMPGVICNIGELNQVILNLVVNAAHAIHDAGRDAETGEIHISTEMAGDFAVIRIRDNGCGIPEEHLSKVYDPFFTTKEVGRGTGQGLSIAHAILVDKHRGSIDVNSRVGVGTEFVLRIPVGGRTAGETP